MCKRSFVALKNRFFNWCQELKSGIFLDRQHWQCYGFSSRFFSLSVNVEYQYVRIKFVFINSEMTPPRKKVQFALCICKFRGQLAYVLFEELEYPQILVSMVILEPVPPQTLKDTCTQNIQVSIRQPWQQPDSNWLLYDKVTRLHLLL